MWTPWRLGCSAEYALCCTVARQAAMPPLIVSHSLQIDIEPYADDGGTQAFPGCIDLPDASALPVANASLGPWVPACSSTQPPAHDLLNATLDIAKELFSVPATPPPRSAPAWR